MKYSKYLGLWCSHVSAETAELFHAVALSSNGAKIKVYELDSFETAILKPYIYLPLVLVN